MTGFKFSPDVIALNPHIFHPRPADPPRPKSPSAWRSEREFMAAVFQEIDRMAILYPEYSLAFHVPNENAHRNPGVRGGYMDICWPIARGTYHCAWIELKVRDGKPSKLQLEVKRKLEAEGHFVAVIWDDLNKVLETMEWYRNL